MGTPQKQPDADALRWLALALTPSLGPTRCRRLVEHFGNAAAVFTASLTELEAVGLAAPAAQAIALGKSLQDAGDELARAAAVGATILPLSDPEYPPLLKQGKLSIEFAILKDGKVSGMTLHTSSGDVALDRAAWASITASNPFPPLPREFPGQVLGLRFYYFYNIDKIDLR